MSGSLYNPDQTAVDTRWIEPWSEAFRAQRDVGLRVPINYVPISAASLTAACFSNNQYVNGAFQRCFSNLLAVGFRKIMVDVYWDAGRSVWSLCPVELPPSEAEPDDQVVSIASGPTVSLSSLASNGEIPTATPVQPGRQGVVKIRQDDSQSSRTSSRTASVGASSTASPAPTSSDTAQPSPSVISFPLGDGRPPLLQVGRYNCTAALTLNHLTGVLEAFLDATGTTTEAVITYITLNLHAAASITNPNAPAQQPSVDQLPGQGSYINDIMRGNLSDEMFTPAKLRSDRVDLNSSWNDVSWNNRPVRGYYASSLDSQDQLTTQDGWPTEAYIEFLKLNRLVASFGSIDPQMTDYNISADLDTIFPPETLRDYRDTSFDSSGYLTEGCLFSASEDTITDSTNSSWAISIPSGLNIDAAPDLDTPIRRITNLTSCGISSWLNTSLANATADQNPLPYAAFVHSTLWTWAPGQPLNATSRNSGSTENRCAGIYLSPNPGRWQVVDCVSRYHVACQDLANPYHWELSHSSTTYLSAESACPEHLSFSVPHTPLENEHLLAAMMNHPSYRDRPEDPIFVDLNSLEVPDCWVQGANGTCPYRRQTDMDRTRVVVVPTIAAVIIFVCAALTFFVKCAANRREDKRGRRRRMVGGWEYEGVPS